MEGVAAAQRIFQVLEIERQSPGLASPRPAPPGGERISFEGVHYAYEDGQRPALNGLSFVIQPNEKVALVGPSGAGKSTTAHLLLRFIEPDQGIITVGNRPLRDLAPATWREALAWVPQNPYLFYGTVAENIRLARPGAPLDDVVYAARQAHAHAFIDALPQGYDTLIGERGTRLSGGEAQRLALARAYLKDAPLLIFDEATANLDPEVEALIQDAMQNLLSGRTALLIAHRLSTVYRADRILVIDRGRLIEEGTHTALWEQGGLYRQLAGAYTGRVP
jgi:ATP-binding cassette subfamily C protein CydD